MLQKTNVIRGVGTLIALLAVSTCWAATNSMTFTNVSGGSISNYPMQFGRQFVQGEIPNYPQAKVDGSAVTTQANVQTRWGDGSVKHVIITFILAGPIANNGTATFTFQNQAGCNCGSGVHETRANMLNTGTYDFDASVGNGTVTMSARAMVTAWDGTTVGPTGMQYWVDGSIATTLLIADHSTARAFDFGNDANKSLRPLFYCTFWPSLSKVKVRFIVENTNTQTIQDQIWNVILKTGNASPATVYTKSSIPQTAATRWTKSFWIGGAPTELYDLDHNLSYLKTTFAVPNYDTAKTVTPTQVAADYSAWASKAKDIYDAGNWQKIMNSGGGRPDIGPFPTWSVNWLYTGDHREREIALVNADLAGAWAMHFREGDPGKFMDKAQTVPALGRMPSISARPTLSFNQMYTEASTSIGDKITPVGTACDPHAGGGNYTVTGASWSPAVATITIGSGHKIVQNQVVTISSLNPSGYNGTVTVTGVTATTFTYALASDPGGPRISGGSVKVGTCTWNWDAAHILSCFTVPYLLTGDYFYLEQQWIWTGFTAAYTPYGSADNGRGLVGSDAAVYRGELRAIAWELRERFEAGNISPDGTAEKALINAWIDDTLAALDGAENLTDSFYNGNPLWNWGRTKVSTNAFFQAPIMPMPLGQFWKGGNGLAVSNVTTITAPVDATQTNVTLASATPFSAHPVDATHQFCAVIDQGTGQVERVRVRARVGTTFTIARGFYGTQVTYGVTAASWVGSTATYTIGAPHDVQVGHLVTISGATPSGYNISNAPVTAISGTTISITMASDPHAWSSGGSVADTSISLTSCNSNAVGSAFPHAGGALFYESSQSGYGIYAPNVYEANSAFEFAYFCYAVGRGAELGYAISLTGTRNCGISRRLSLSRTSATQSKSFPTFTVSSQYRPWRRINSQ